MCSLRGGNEPIEFGHPKRALMQVRPLPWSSAVGRPRADGIDARPSPDRRSVPLGDAVRQLLDLVLEIGFVRSDSHQVIDGGVRSLLRELCGSCGKRDRLLR
jgi:hypothetical protein